MDNNVKSAIDNIALIKSVIDKTQKDFSKISEFIIWVGVINIILFIAEQFSYYLRNVNGYGTFGYNISAAIVQIFTLPAYIICYIIYYRKMRSTNDLSIGMLKVWGIVLIGSQLLLKIYIIMIPNINNIAANMLWRCKEFIEIFPIIAALLMTGILTKKRLIVSAAAITSVIWLFLFAGMREMKYGTLGGAGTRLPVSSVFIKAIMTFGVICLGLYLRRGDKEHGDKINT